MGFIINNGVLEKYIEEEEITEITIPDGVTEIGYLAFKGCHNLTVITKPGSYADEYFSKLADDENGIIVRYEDIK